MGLSLRNIGKKITDVLGDAENVAAGVGRQINPFDNGATYSNPHPAPGPSHNPVEQDVSAANTAFSALQHIPVIGSGLTTASDVFNLASHIPQVNLSQKINNPILRTVASIPESVINTPGSAGRSFVQLRSGNVHTLPQLTSTVANIAQLPLLFLGPSEAAGKSVLGKIGVNAATGGAFGELSGIANNPNAKNVGQQFAQALPSAATGAVLGGATTAASEGIKAAVGPHQAPIDKLTSYEGAPDRAKVEAYKKDILAGKQLDPIKVAPDSLGNVGVVDGKHRLQAYKELGFQNVPVQTDLLNQRGSIQLPGGAAPTAEELKIGKGLEMTPQEVAKAKASLNAGPSLDEPGGPAEVKQGNKVALKEATSKAPSYVNTARNPTKVDIPTVKAGDYAHARVNGQLASNPVEFAGGQTLTAIRKLTDDEKANFWKSVEDPKLPRSPQLEEAISRWSQVADRAHATSQALGGNTNYVQNYARHPWDLSGWDEANQGPSPSSANFRGLNSISRKHMTIAEGEKAGLTLKTDPLTDVTEYVKAASSTLRKQALMKGLTEADTGEAVKPHTFDLGFGKTVDLSDKGLKEVQGLTQAPEAGVPLKAYRAVNRKTKQTLLSLSEFHPLNVGLKAASTEVLNGRPVNAAKMLYDTFRSQVGSNYSDKLQQAFQEDDLPDFGARVGSPLKYGSDYATEGKLNLGKSGLGERTIFEKAMPAMQGRMLQGLRADLDARGIPYDSPEALAAGTRVNEIMGFVNKEVRNLNASHQRGLGDVLLAPQFTRAKWATLKSALTEKGLGGSYARKAVLGNAVALTAITATIAALNKQKSDNTKDVILRSLFHPSIPTPWKDSNGNTLELGLPGSYTSEALGLAFTLVRDKSGHLSVQFKPEDIPGNVAQYGRARLATIPSVGLKVATNTNYANRPLYDPNAPAGQKVEQAATTAIGGELPIGAQGLLQVGAIKKHLPGAVQEIETANTPGTNPLLKSVASSFGATPRSDKTTGQALQTNQYFDSLDKAKTGLNRQEQDALDIYSGSKKNPVTGKYDVAPNVNDTRVKAVTLLQNPKVIDHLIQLNQTLASQGQKVDPLWGLSKDQITKVLQYQAMPPAGPDAAVWKINNPWYNQVAQSRSQFFDSLPPGDPNKPPAPIQYPTASPAISNLQQNYFNLTSSADKASYIRLHPALQDQFNKQDEYYNQMRVAEGYDANKLYPTASPDVQQFITKYLAADKAGRASLRNTDTEAYRKMAAYFDAGDLYNINKQGGINSQQSQPDTNPIETKAIANVAQDIYNVGGTPTVVPAGFTQGLTNSNASPKHTKSPHFYKPHVEYVKVKRGRNKGSLRVASHGAFSAHPAKRQIAKVALKGISA